jgi:exodeoxyribonuclease VII large subunit
MDLLESRLPMTLERMLMERRHQLMQIETTLKGFDPQLLLSRGYSITLHEGHAITDASMLSPGDELETRVAKGVIYSKVLVPDN